ncbi:MAG: hypothetical protein M1476_00100, partial [Candidatus Thermoplasmatota archaeon]|nr:hypothetical protein [Candidatus Thermoplasmatota archaeon]
LQGNLHSQKALHSEHPRHLGVSEFFPEYYEGVQTLSPYDPNPTEHIDPFPVGLLVTVGSLSSGGYHVLILVPCW